MTDLIDRQKIKAKFEPWLKVKGYSEGELNIIRAVLYEITIMPSAQPECDDTVSRKAEIDAIKRYIRGFDAIDVNFLDGLKTAIQIIEQLPHEYSNAQNALQRIGSVECEDAVSRQAAIDACLKGKTDGLPATNVACDCCAERIRVLPSADAVEVVRCKYCKHSTEWYRDKRRCFLWCEDGIDVFEDGYCSYWEKKDGRHDKQTGGD